VEMCKNPNEGFLQNILSFFLALRVTSAQAHEFGFKKIIEDALSLRIPFFTLIEKYRSSYRINLFKTSSLRARILKLLLGLFNVHDSPYCILHHYKFHIRVYRLFSLGHSAGTRFSR
jgi:hypothetical protein